MKFFERSTTPKEHKAVPEKKPEESVPKPVIDEESGGFSKPEGFAGPKENPAAEPMTESQKKIARNIAETLEDPKTLFDEGEMHTPMTLPPPPPKPRSDAFESTGARTNPLLERLEAAKRKNKPAPKPNEVDDSIDPEIRPTDKDSRHKL